MPGTLVLGGKCQRYFIFGSKLKKLHLKAFLSGTLELASESKVESGVEEQLGEKVKQHTDRQGALGREPAIKNDSKFCFVFGFRAPHTQRASARSDALPAILNTALFTFRVQQCNEGNEIPSLEWQHQLLGHPVLSRFI
ncbi:unnamed protein product [Sphenostylis stenocarpa]|uniref:Uncharacterized protein n=1 Tax=Sphenostylis stenocarpa TaxID=92480 RepID=A0AA86V8U2_9FABA|nr:unnamed protein product [Sphenostylis stenocarpa]